MKDKSAEIPSGLDHLTMLKITSARVTGETASHFDDFKTNRSIIGTCLNALYQAATCYRQCHGGGHLLERLCGRAYNLGYAANQLALIGLYDESLSLVRSLGELTNLIMLGVFDPPKIQEWVKADRKTRMDKFGPSKVRRMLEKKGHICADDDWYKEFSEEYSHVTPNTKPNFHGGASFIGGKFEKEGAEKCFGQLMYVLSMLSLIICKYFKFDDLFAEITATLRDEHPDTATHSKSLAPQSPRQRDQE